MWSITVDTEFVEDAEVKLVMIHGFLIKCFDVKSVNPWNWREGLTSGSVAERHSRRWTRNKAGKDMYGLGFGLLGST